VLVALERALERERPGFRVTWAAASASAATRRTRLDPSGESHLPGNGAPAAPLTRSVAVAPSAPEGATAAYPFLAPCLACGGATRVAVVDLAQESATVECVACGLRRHDGPGTGAAAVVSERAERAARDS
jgi:hypothetical protein